MYIYKDSDILNTFKWVCISEYKYRIYISIYLPIQGGLCMYIRIYYIYIYIYITYIYGDMYI